MNLPDDLLTPITLLLQEKFSPQLNITGFKEISGGCINPAGALITTEGSFFVKWNSSSKYPGMFVAEANGLKLIAATNTLEVPEVISVIDDGNYQALVMTLVNNDTPSSMFWKDFGIGLAHLHSAIDRVLFGLANDNYIGSLHQQNDERKTWVEFFVENRLKVQVKLAVDAGADNRFAKRFEKLFDKLPLILPVERPSLLHGDLWRGNLMTSNGKPCLIDPAVYYGHREADLAMTQLFGGFDQRFLHHYEEVFPLEPGWRDRMDIYNLYPLLVHLNLFGENYRSPIDNILKRFG